MGDEAIIGPDGEAAAWPAVARELGEGDEALLAYVREVARPHLAAVRALPAQASDPQLAQALADDVDRLWDVALHYRLKEELLLPCLADLGVADAHAEEEADGEARSHLSMARSLVAGAAERPTASNLASAADQVEDACAAVERVARAELEGLLPLAVATLAEGEWARLEADRALYPAEASPDAPLWPSSVDRMEASVRHAIETGRLPGAHP